MLLSYRIEAEEVGSTTDNPCCCTSKKTDFQTLPRFSRPFSHPHLEDPLVRSGFRGQQLQLQLEKQPLKEKDFQVFPPASLPLPPLLTEHYSFYEDF